ncbi:MAG: SIS domain-containing protein [Myxacorys californica WJT36-NPBG1]|jgi:glucosamine--fructose-6-phosphate aminotransferase (isomerizing)|nr:SIS domain-containing protein [Myxacorys californica WJT36-NPBG1]
MALQKFQHFMLKEIYEQPEVIRHSLNDPNKAFQVLPTLDQVEEIQILACGTSFHAGLVGQFLLEQVAGIPTRVRSASEFLAAPFPRTRNTLLMVVSQSGETADVLAAMQAVKQSSGGAFKILAITNNSQSSIATEADCEISVAAGVETSVAATKTFTAQLALFYGLAFFYARQGQHLSHEQLKGWNAQLDALPAQVEKVLQQEATIAAIAASLKDTKTLILLGTGINYPLALEGALKLKETTYTHAEGYAAGEFLHGPIALLDQTIPAIAICPSQPSRSASAERILKVAQKISSNGSDVILLGGSDAAIVLPPCEELLSPFLNIVPLQLLAYHLAIARTIDVDRPRNITKFLKSS